MVVCKHIVYLWPFLVHIYVYILPFHINTVQLVQRDDSQFRYVVDGAERIAQHYGYTLNAIFETQQPDALYAIVIEDDMCVVKIILWWPIDDSVM